MELRLTADGSNTIFSDIFFETYHSVNGAVTESTHVFINAGLKRCTKTSIRVFEVGFGTGLNALLTCVEAEKLLVDIEYHSVELYPLEMEVIKSLNYSDSLSLNSQLFNSLHKAPWNVTVQISPTFRLRKISSSLQETNMLDKFDVVYFDAFSPAIQPELWTMEVFSKIYNNLHNNAILTTYCAKGEVRRNMQAAGFKVERLPGPPGKREMLRATKGGSL